MNFAKIGDRVELIIRKDSSKNCGDVETVHGVVKKGGSETVTVILDGGKKQVKCHVSLLEISDHHLPTDPPNLMDKYSIIKFKSAEVGRTLFSCTVRKDGKPFVEVEQHGHGGPNRYDPIDIKKDREIYMQFLKDAKEWTEMFGDKDAIEPEDTWVEWWYDLRPYGVTAKMHMKEFTDFMKEHPIHH